MSNAAHVGYVYPANYIAGQCPTALVGTPHPMAGRCNLYRLAIFLCQHQEFIVLIHSAVLKSAGKIIHTYAITSAGGRGRRGLLGNAGRGSSVPGGLYLWLHVSMCQHMILHVPVQRRQQRRQRAKATAAAVAAAGAAGTVGRRW